VSLFIQTISDVCRTNLLTEKWLVAPSLRVGHQWIETAVRRGQPTVNLHIKTVRSLVVDLAAPEMAVRGVTLASKRASALLVDRLLRKLRGQFKYLANVEPGAGVSETFLATIESLRMAGLDATNFSLGAFEVSTKGQDLAHVAAEYLKLLAKERLVDVAEVLRIATERLDSKPESLGTDTLVLLPVDLRCEALERRLLDKFPVAQCRVLPVDEPAEAATPHDGVSSNLSRLRWMLNPAAAPPARSDDTVRVVRTVGEVNEIRHALRTCVARGIPWDDVELLHTDAETYVTLVYETVLAIGSLENGRGEDLPVTFAEGIPCRYSRPGRALIAWLRWIRSGFPQVALERMLKEGLLALSGDDEDVSGFGRLAGLLRPLGIGAGRDRYSKKVEERVVSLRQELEAVKAADDDDAPDRRSQIERDLRDLGIIGRLLARLLEHSPDLDAPQHEVISKAARFVEHSARSVNKLDRFASVKLLEELRDMEHWLKHDDGQAGIDLWEWLEELPAETRVMGSGPRPGCLHVDSVYSGGHSGRPHTFIVGLDDSRFPGAGLQDPLLLDSERRALSLQLPTARRRMEDRLQDFVRLLARLRGDLTLSFACQSFVEDREMFASPAVLAVFRLLTGRPNGDQQDLLAWMEPPVSFAPRRPEECLDASEWWLWRLCGPETVVNVDKLVDRRYPHLAEGRKAAAARLAPEFGPYDGCIPQAGADLNPTLSDGLVLSANSLKTMGACPRAFLFRYGLKIKPPEDSALDPARWLDPLMSGELLHELFEEFIREISARDLTPELVRDKARIEELLDARIDRYKQIYPPPNENAYQRQVKELRNVTLTFLSEEERFCTETNSRPVFLEASLGMTPGEHGTPLDDPEPILVSLMGGKSIRARGRVDRIDRVGESALATYAIWDYKTGSDYSYDPADPFRQGRIIQPFLYASMVAHRLKSVVSPQAKVIHFGFFFPGKPMGRRILWTSEQLGHGQEILSHLVDSIIQGAFLATNNYEEDCRFCDYRPICGDLAAVSAASQRKLDATGTTMLDSFRALRPGKDS